MNSHFFTLFSLISTADSLVVTKLDLNTLNFYYNRIVKYENDISLESDLHFLNGYLYNFCHALRQSKVFVKLHVSKKPDPEPNYCPVDYILDERKLKLERQEAKRIPTELRIHNYTSKTLSSFKCMDLKGEFKWFIASAVIPESAFLFIRDTTLDVEVSNGNQHLIEHLPKLAALIDKSGELTEDTVWEGEKLVLENFIQSIKHSDRESGSKISTDELCNLSPLIKYRLCAGAASALTDLFPSQVYEVNKSLTYRNQARNIYYQPVDPKDSCRPVSVNTRNHPDYPKNVTRNLLHCALHVVNEWNQMEEFQFYLSLNSIKPTRAIVIEGRRAKPTKEITMPLLKYLQIYANILGHEN